MAGRLRMGSALGKVASVPTRARPGPVSRDVPARPKLDYVPAMTNSYGSRSTLSVGSKSYDIYRLDALDKAGIATTHLPFSLQDPARKPAAHRGRTRGARRRHRGAGQLGRQGRASREIAFTPSRVLLQDFTGVPAVVDLAAMRDAMVQAGRRRRARSTRCSRPSWSSTTRCRSTSSAPRRRCHINADLEFQRNRERYAFLRWGQTAFPNFRSCRPTPASCTR